MQELIEAFGPDQTAMARIKSGTRTRREWPHAPALRIARISGGDCPETMFGRQSSPHTSVYTFVS